MGPGGPAPGGSFELQPDQKKKFQSVATFAKVFGALSLVLAALSILASLFVVIQHVLRGSASSLISVATGTAGELLTGVAAGVVAFSYFTASKSFAVVAKGSGNAIPSLMDSIQKIGKAYLFEVIVLVVSLVLFVILFFIGTAASVVAG